MLNRAHVVVFCLAALLAVCVLFFWLCSVVPTVDFYNVPGYRQELERSQNPIAKTIQAEIANGPADLARAKAAASQAGIPLTPAPMPPESENAYVGYEKWFAAARTTKTFFDGSADPLRMNIVNTPRQLAADQKVIDNHLEVFALADQAMGMTQYVAPLGVYHEASLRLATRETVTRAYLLAYQGRFMDAVSMQERGFAIARQVGGSTSQVNYLLSASLANVTLHGMQNLLYMAGPDLSKVQQVEQAVEAFHLTPRADGMRRSVLSVLVSLDSHRNDSSSKMSKSLQPNLDYYGTPPASTLYSQADRQFVNDYIDAVEARYLNDTLSGLAQIKDDPDAALPLIQSESMGAGVENLIDPISTAASDIEAWKSASIMPERYTASRQVTLAAATLLAAKAKTGAYPPTLPAEFTDPFNHNKPLGYRVDQYGKGFVVYSVGETGKFDGGAPDKWYLESVFRYPAPPAVAWTP